MGETEVRNEIEELKAELLTIRKELSLRYGLLKGDAFTGVKIAAIAVASLYGLKFALKLLKALLGFILRHKMRFVLLGALCYLGYRSLTNTQGEQGEA
jgi:hypothetical protein